MITAVVFVWADADADRFAMVQGVQESETHQTLEAYFQHHVGFASSPGLD